MGAAPHVVIVGGGFAGLETAFSLRQELGDRVRLTLVADQERFLFKPNTIYLPFGGDERSLWIPLADPMFRRHIALQLGRLSEVDTDARRVSLEDGTRLRHDFLVLATGAAMRPQKIAGLAERAQTVWTPQQMLALGVRLRTVQAEARHGTTQRVLFLVPPGNKCAGPLYEIALMLDSWLRRMDARERIELTWTTYESGYVQAFGPRLHHVVRHEFERRGIEGHTDAVVDKVHEHRVDYTGTARSFDLLVAFPPYVAVDYPTLPRDQRGFVLTEPATRRVQGHPEVYAPGDAGDFPVKQAFLAFLQADAVADDIAALVYPPAVPAPHRYVPTSMCVMEMLDRATFAQVPLEVTGDPERPVRVAPDADGDYRVGTSPLWRLGKGSALVVGGQHAPQHGKPSPVLGLVDLAAGEALGQQLFSARGSIGLWWLRRAVRLLAPSQCSDQEHHSADEKRPEEQGPDGHQRPAETRHPVSVPHHGSSPAI